MTDIQSIPTEYSGILFRSRLEARWASTFDGLGWPWEYEPIQLNGYVPDFILTFHKPMLVEVKPVFSADECREHAEKIDRSGWDKEAIILGATIKMGGGSSGSGLGYYKQFCCVTPSEFLWDGADFFKCTNCREFSFCHQQWKYECVARGCYDGDHYLGDRDAAVNELERIWREAANLVRYEARRAHHFTR